MCSSLKCGQDFSLQSSFLHLKRMVLCVPTLEVLKDGNVGPHPFTSATSLLIRFMHVAVSLQCLVNVALSPSPVFNAVFSIDSAQQMAVLTKISNHSLVSSMVSASRRILGRAKVEKDPVIPEML